MPKTRIFLENYKKSPIALRPPALLTTVPPAYLQFVVHYSAIYIIPVCPNAKHWNIGVTENQIQIFGKQIYAGIFFAILKHTATNVIVLFDMKTSVPSQPSCRYK